MSDMKRITFEPLDSLFFREAKPFNAGEGGFLDSQFPPPAQTLSGAIRSAIGEANGIDWKDTTAVTALLGMPNDPTLSFAGPYLFKEGQRLYPVPLNLLYSESDKERKWTRLVPSEMEYTTDMDRRQLPTPKESLEGAKRIEEGCARRCQYAKSSKRRFTNGLHSRQACFRPRGTGRHWP